MPTRPSLVLAALILQLATAGCGAAPDAPDTDAREEATDEAVQALVGRNPEIDFAERPSYLPRGTLALSFDDGPDETYTVKVLDILKQRRIRGVTFFINTKNYGGGVAANPTLQGLVRRMVNDGHTLGNHTVSHAHLGTLGASQIESEIAGVETTVRQLFGFFAPSLTLFRAPYGEPYQDRFNGRPEAEAPYALVAPIVARHAVQIGWGVLTNDTSCADADCVYNNFVSAVDVPGNGSYGVVLMHSTQAQTVEALPRILDYIDAKGFRLITVEQVVRARFGVSSSSALLLSRLGL
jgi:peptidoglycan/xylan/chitin deacetylase (PgdA/CDA1 family)